MPSDPHKTRSEKMGAIGNWAHLWKSRTEEHARTLGHFSIKNNAFTARFSKKKYFQQNKTQFFSWIRVAKIEHGYATDRQKLNVLKRLFLNFPRLADDAIFILLFVRVINVIIKISNIINSITWTDPLHHLIIHVINSMLLNFYILHLL